MRKKTSEHRSTVTLNGLAVPVRIITERGRRATTCSVRERALYIRLPHGLATAEQEKRLQEMLAWADKLAKEKPESFRHFHLPPVTGAYTFDFRGTIYDIRVQPYEAATHRIEARGTHGLTAFLCTRDLRPKVLPKLLAKFFAGKYLPLVTRRVHALNDRHFQRPIKQVRLNDTYSRWGSCNPNGNINLATRLLLAPDEVIDAVVIHELAHLVHADHSPRFWAEVARALPDYEVHDAWLRKHGNALRFVPLPT